MAEQELVDKIISYEAGEMTPKQITEFFSELLKSGLIWQLQGHYGRTATNLIKAGYLDRSGKILKGVESHSNGVHNGNNEWEIHKLTKDDAIRWIEAALALEGYDIKYINERVREIKKGGDKAIIEAYELLYPDTKLILTSHSSIPSGGGDECDGIRRQIKRAVRRGDADGELERFLDDLVCCEVRRRGGEC